MTDLRQKLKLAEEREAHFEAIDLLGQLVSEFPDETELLYKLGLKYLKTGDPLKAEKLLLECTEAGMDTPLLDINMGHALKSMGRFDEAADAYKRVISDFDDERASVAYWSLANLKTYKFTDEEIDTMRATVTAGGGDADDQSHLAFALGKGLEDRKAFDRLGERLYKLVRSKK